MWTTVKYWVPRPPNFKEQDAAMDELYEKWLELRDAGETDEDFESWYSGEVEKGVSRYERYED